MQGARTGRAYKIIIDTFRTLPKLFFLHIFHVLNVHFQIDALVLQRSILIVFSLSEQNVNELNQWLSAIRKVSIYNEGMLPSFHPGAHRSGKWTCCLQGDRAGNPAFIIHSFPIRACLSTQGSWVGGGAAASWRRRGYSLDKSPVVTVLHIIITWKYIINTSNKCSLMN